MNTFTKWQPAHMVLDITNIDTGYNCCGGINVNNGRLMPNRVKNDWDRCWKVYGGGLVCDGCMARCCKISLGETNVKDFSSITRWAVQHLQSDNRVLKDFSKRIIKGEIKVKL